ncbi:MAG: flagellar biosynthetic protein FliO [Lachnospiraceae bacterium]|nr:flagellar biosynthetic protein FliO [Lachnospiraceae bacterium]
MIFLLTSGYSGTQSILKLIGLIILCALIIAASYFVTRFIGGREAGMTGSSNFKVIDAYRLSPNKYLQIIQIGSRYFCIAVSKDDVRLICELNEEDIKIRQKSEKMLSFKDILTKASGNKDKVEMPEEDKEKNDPERD